MKTVHKLKRTADKIVSYLYSFYNAVRPRKKVKESDNVLLVSGGHIGDAIMDASAWEALIEYYSGKGKTIYFFSSKGNWNLFKRILDTEKVIYIGNDFDGSDDISSVRKIIHAIGQQEFDTIAARFHANRKLFLGVLGARSRYRYAVAEQEMLFGFSGALCRLLRGRYTDLIIETINESECESLEILLHHMGLTDYRMHLIPIPGQDGISTPSKPYITIAVDTQNKIRRWGSDKFIELIETLLNITDKDIYLTGNTLSAEEMIPYNDRFHDTARLKNTVGKLSLNEWIELIRGADFHIGVDSGSIHIASSVGTIAFCLSGVWQGYRFFPYRMKEFLPGTAAPVCIYRKDVDVDRLPCFGCATNTRRYGTGDPECRRRCCAGQPCLCLENITVEDVVTAIEKARQDGKLNQ